MRLLSVDSRWQHYAGVGLVDHMFAAIPRLLESKLHLVICGLDRRQLFRWLGLPSFKVRFVQVEADLGSVYRLGI